MSNLIHCEQHMLASGKIVNTYSKKKSAAKLGNVQHVELRWKNLKRSGYLVRLQIIKFPTNSTSSALWIYGSSILINYYQLEVKYTC